MCGDLVTFEQTLAEALARWGLSASTAQTAQLRTHFEAVVEANRSLNLTRIVDPLEAAVKHYADSLALLLWVNKRAISVNTVLDIGTGAGFPAVPLAVMRPDWTVTAIDATGKKISFLKQIVATMGLSNLRLEHAHSNHWCPNASFQLVVLRAVTRLSNGIVQMARHAGAGGEGALPVGNAADVEGLAEGRRLLRSRPTAGGWLVAYKTAKMDPQELKAASATAAGQGLREQEPLAYDLHLRGETLPRVLRIYEKVAS